MNENMNRSHSFVNSFKWWPLQNSNHSSNNNNSNNNSNNNNNGNCNGNRNGNAVSIDSGDCSRNNVRGGVHHQSSNSGNSCHNNFKGRIIGFNKTQRFGSFVAVQKLRESKWFKSDEYRIFCAVIESGFIVELRSSAAVARKLLEEQERKKRRESFKCKQRQQQKQQKEQEHNKIKVSCRSTSSNIEEISNDFIKPLNHIPFEDHKSHNSGDDCHDKQLNDIVENDYKDLIGDPDNDDGDGDDDDDDDDDDDEIVLRNDNDRQIASWFGIVLCKTTKDNKTKPDTIEIFSVKIRDNGTFRLMKWSLQDVWNNNWELRICNFADKEKEAHNEKDIRNQVTFARKTRQSLWHNTKHFTYWCRYGSRQQDVRKRQISECIKWGSIGMNAGMILLMNKPKSYFPSK